METYILNIETTGKNCSVCITKNGEIVSIKENYSEKYNHSEQLNVFIEEIINKASISFKDLSAIAVSKGPGSYTGLRIGVSSAKGFCYALDIPLIAVDTMKALCNSVSIENGYYVPMLDARRMEVYHSILDSDLNFIQDTTPLIIDEESLTDYKQDLYLFGDGAEKCKEVFNNREKIHFVDGIYPSSKDMAKLSYAQFQSQEFEDVAYFEPFYLKAFKTTKPKKTMLEKLNKRFRMQ